MNESPLDQLSDGTLIWGAGAIGGTVGAFLARAGHPIAFVDIDRDHVNAIGDPSRGLHISGPVSELTVRSAAWTPGQVRGEWKRILLSVKAHHTEEACRALAPHLAADGYVVSLQNGLCEPIIAGIVGLPRTIGAFINFGADWIAPGEKYVNAARVSAAEARTDWSRRVICIVYSNRGAVVVGEIDGRVTPRLRDLHALLRIFEPEAIVTDRIASYLWGKLGYAALLFAQATGQLGIADCLARPELLPLWRDLAGETIKVAIAEGVDPRGFNGFDPIAFRPGATEEQARRSVAEIVAFNRPNPKTHSGVWRDLAIRKRRTEVNAQIAPIVAAGQRHGIACPRLSALVGMLHEIENGARPLSDDNLRELLLTPACAIDNVVVNKRSM